jgi:hypothetical protein
MERNGKHLGLPMAERVERTNYLGQLKLSSLKLRCFLRLAVHPGQARHLDSFLGPRYNEKANDPGAQTERRGDAGPVSVLIRGCDSPAAFVQESGIRDQ